MNLIGQRFLITRAREQNEELRRLLVARGASVVELPLIQIKPLTVTPSPTLAADYRWLIFTSANGVDNFFNNRPANSELAKMKIAAVGVATSERLRALGLHVDFMPKIYTAESLCVEWPDANGGKALHVCGNLAQNLAIAGWQVDRLVVYETVEAPLAAEHFREIFADTPPDWVIFCSASAVWQFHKVTNGGLPSGLKIASIGPVTGAAIREAGWRVDLEASVSRLETLVAELALL